MASIVYDPEWIKKTIRDCWSFLSAQLGHWNSSKIIAMDFTMYQKLPKPVLDGLAFEAGKFHNKECMWLQDGVKMDVYVLGIKEHLQKNVSTTSSGCVVWDPLKKHSLVSKKGTGLRKRMDGQPRRPPNAFILYRKDQHPEIKRMYPEIHNNEISILTGSMWKSESEEIRQKYHLRAMAIKKALLKDQPHYKYQPRRSDEIQRRRRQLPVKQENGQLAPDSVIVNGQEDVIPQPYSGTVAAVTNASDNSTGIYQEHGMSSPTAGAVGDWTPTTLSEHITETGLPLPWNFPVPSVDQAAVFGQVLPRLEFNGANTPPTPVEHHQKDSELRKFLFGPAVIMQDIEMHETGTFGRH
ncbi:hypothetical protein B0T14DRAFT_561263 [Immersiella caudata]|uniref:HMG box domain-containing protein n=1 Tax=Immersiella caudata TaxID=314043 RepID=A0AA40CCF8_9PEZI|nr:hypothetical protein B0T14DRAFT_561263 [Immersiella caudata]